MRTKAVTLFVALLFLAHGAIPDQAVAQPLNWGIGIASSFHSHDYESPLPWWDNSGLVFPSVMLRAELPMRFIEGPLGEKLHLRSGIRYTRLASRVDWEFDVTTNPEPFTGKFSINQHYLAVPVQFRLEIGNSPLYLLAGPEFGFLIFARKKSETITPEEFSSSMNEGVGSDIHTVNITLGGGIGYKINQQIRTFARYNAGLRNAKKSAGRTVLDSDWQTKEFEVGVEFNFNGKKDP